MTSRFLSTIALVSALVMTFCWAFQATSRLDELEHKVTMLQGQSVAQQGVVEGMYYDKVPSDSRVGVLEEQVEAIQGAIAILIHEATLRISPKE